jgi:hypothetical protein
MTKNTDPTPNAPTTDTIEDLSGAAVVTLDTASPEVLGEPGADDPDASELAPPEDPEAGRVDDLDELLDLVDERVGYEVDRAGAVVEWLARRGVRLALAQRRNLGLS